MPLNHLTTTKHMQTIKTSRTSWIDINNPTAEDVAFLKKNFELYPTVLKEYLKRNKQTKIEKYKNYLFIILYFPIFDRKERKTNPAEIDFIVTKNAVITSHYESIPPFQKLIQETYLSAAAKRKYFRSNAHLFFNLINILLDACQPMLDHTHENIDNLHNQIFQKKEEELLSEIAIVKRDINDFRLIMRPQQSLLEIITARLTRFFKQQPRVLPQEVMSSYLRVWHRLEVQKEMIEAIEKTNESLLSFKMNQTFKAMTIFSTLLLPLFFLISVFGLYTFNRPVFMAMLGLLSLVSIVTFIIYLVLRHKRKL